MHNSTTRFSSRVANYVRYRPRYPAAVYTLLAARCGLHSASVIADIGSGTGISSELFLAHGHHVIGVEPNADMRAAAESLLGAYPRFVSVNGTAEHTTLSAGSVDLVVAGQAYHWFDPEPGAREFQRVLRPDGWIALIWNDRQTSSTPFLRGYEALLREFSTDYSAIDHKNSDPDQLGVAFERAQFANAQRFDYAGLEGRLLSSSYAPESGHPNHAPMLRALRALFDAHQRDGAVEVLYTTDVYSGRF
jgi:SAM-dependent methyltransferase